MENKVEETKEKGGILVTFRGVVWTKGTDTFHKNKEKDRILRNQGPGFLGFLGGGGVKDLRSYRRTYE